MLSLPASVRIFLCLEIADMRRGFDGLAAMVTELLKDDPLSGHMFVFRNRRRDRVKILYWDRDGYALWYKRLEKGTFKFPSVTSSRSHRVEVKASDLMMLLDGVDLRSVRREKRYARARLIGS
ncbi:MAG: IS66 family insertion sequence element accessory protein TnpB [bacterium]|nr:IS66 family insertion sequence element accessory protein TnpB [bacterium]